MSEPVDTSKVFKELVHCFECDQPFYFTLWAIAENQNLACPQCGMEINVADHVYQSLLASVQERVAEISSFQCAPPGDRQDRERASGRLGHHPDLMSKHTVSIATPESVSSSRGSGAPPRSTARDLAPNSYPGAIRV
jgi:hypothetical protein